MTPRILMKIVIYIKTIIDYIEGYFIFRNIVFQNPYVTLMVLFHLLSFGIFVDKSH